MAENETSTENKAKILLDEANITFCETSERKDSAENRTLDGSPWDMGRMDGEFDEEDFQKFWRFSYKPPKFATIIQNWKKKPVKCFNRSPLKMRTRC